MYEELLNIFDAVRFDSSVRAVIITGSGRGFCAGHDLHNAGAPGWIPGAPGKAQFARAVMAKLSALPVIMRALPQPVIVAVNGVTAGAGYALALAADLCLAAKSAKFVNAFHNAGTGHELGFSYMLPRAIGTQRAAELMLTGRPVLAEEAAAIGLVLRSTEDAELPAAALALAKQSMWLNANIGSLEAAIELENRGIFVSQSTEDAAEKRKSFIEKRRPAFFGR
jgi:enoyl-CoA hydratase